MKKQWIKKFQILLASLKEEEYGVLEKFLGQWELNAGLEFYFKEEQERSCLRKVLEIGRALNAADNLDSLLAMILDRAIEVVKAERGFILMAPEGNVVVARNFDREWVQEPEYKVSHSIAGAVLQSGKPILTENAQIDQQINITGSVRKLGLKSVLCVPLIARNEVLGVVYLDNRFCYGAFGSHHLYILETFAEQAALAFQETRLRQAIIDQHRQIETLVEKLKNDDGKHFPSQDKIACTMIHDISDISNSYCFGKMISCNRAMNKLFQMARQTASSGFPILITGESGTGKELLARAVHDVGKHSQGQFIEENCASIADTLLESELFGYVRGAFTGATADRKGLFDMADRGSLFLDEVGEMSLSMQAKLLKVLETGMIRPLGSQQWHKVDVCIISATHRNLLHMISENKFREDLWYRLRVIALEIPPLRQRPDDIPLLVNHFLATNPQALSKQIRTVEPQAMEILSNYHWPGNVRQLEHEIKKIVALKQIGEKIRVQDIACEVTKRDYLYISSGLTLREATRRFTHNYVVETLRDTHGNKSRAAKILGVSRRSLYNKVVASPDGSKS